MGTEIWEERWVGGKGRKREREVERVISSLWRKLGVIEGFDVRIKFLRGSLSKLGIFCFVF